MPRTITFLLSLGWAALSIFSSAHAQDPSTDHLHRTILQGIDELYSLEFDSSLATFDRVISQSPSDLRGYFFKGMVHFWIFNVNRDERQFAELGKLFSAVIERGEEILDNDEDNAIAAFYLGGAYGFRGLAHQRNGSLWSAIWDGRKGYKYLEEAIELDSTLYDAHMGFGLFRYLVAKVPGSYRWVLSLIGFSGDEEGGLRSLALAAERGTYTRTEASFFLSQFLFFEDRTDDALKYFVPLLERYPENSIFQLAYAGWQYQLENLEEAKASVEKAIAINARKNIRTGDELAYTVRYQIAFAENDFEKAKQSILIAIDKSENQENISNTMYYRLGLSYEILGQRDSATVAYKNVRSVNDEERAYDTYASRKARERLRSPLSRAEMTILRGGNLHSAHRYEEAIALHSSAAEMSRDNPDDLAEALYGLMRAHYELKNDREVVTLSRRLLALDPSRELWCIPHGYFKLGQAYARLGMVAEARRAFEEVEEYDDYDYRISLENRVERELRRLEER